MAAGGMGETGYKRAMKKNHLNLSTNLKVSDGLLSDLYSEDVLSDEEHDKLEEIADGAEARKKLVKVMKSKSVSEIKKFLEVLEKWDQKKLANDIQDTAGQPLPIPQEEKEIISSLPKESRLQCIVRMPAGPPRAILLLGKTGSGKSSLGNNIMNSEEFPSEGSPTGVTVKVKMVTKIVHDRIITCVDTPGTMDPEIAKENAILDEIVGAIVNSPDGYDAIIIVLKYPVRYTKEQQKAIEKFQLIFGEEVGQYGLVVFTGGDTYKKEKERKKLSVNFTDYVETVKASSIDPMRQLFEFYKGGWLLVDNFEKGENLDWQMNQLVQLVDDISESSNGERYNGQVFKVARDVAIEAMKNNPGITKEEVKKLQMKAIKKEARRRAGGDCFPSNSVVIGFSGETVAISEVSEGDQVLVMLSNSILGYDTVYMQGHNDADATMNTVTLTTSTGKQLTASDDHFIYVTDSNTTQRMCDINVGDHVLAVFRNEKKSHKYQITSECVTKKEHTTSLGMYNPMTLSGTIVVDNIIATNYERPLHPAMAHMLLAPVRGLYRVAPWLVRAVNSFRYQGVPAWAYGVMTVITWLTDIKGQTKFELL